MQTVEVDANNIKWPARCCRCGSNKFSWYEHSDDVVIWTTLGVTKYQKISLNIPACAPCMNAKILWFGAAITFPAISMLIMKLFYAESRDVPTILLLLVVLGPIFGLVGVRKKPIQIIKYDEKRNALKLKIYNNDVAKQIPKVDGSS